MFGNLHGCCGTPFTFRADPRFERFQQNYVNLKFGQSLRLLLEAISSDYLKIKK